MLGLDPKAARWTWTVALVLLCLFALFRIREPIFVFVIAILLAYMLAPLVGVINRLLPTNSRIPALGLTYILLVGIFIVVAIELGSRIVDEATSLVARAPQFVQNLQNAGPNLPLPESLRALEGDVFAHVQSFVRDHAGDIMGYVSAAGMKLLTFSSYLLFVVIVPILSFFMLKDGAKIRNALLQAIPGGPPRQLWSNIISDTDVLLGRYVRAVGLLCLTTFVVFAVVFAMLGVPYGVLLAAVSMALEFIPMVGPLVAAVTIVAVTQATGYGHLLVILLFLGVYRLFQDYVVSPRLMSAGVEVPPLLVIFGVLAGEKLGGIPGMFLSVPLIAFFRILYVRVLAAAELESNEAEMIE